ncbi:MAG TPA: alpha/beta hydrolase [Micromonosporaceae bacterium]
MEIDVLGEPYQQMSIDLGTDDEGAVRATLIRRLAGTLDGRAVLYIHGFTDYFFQTHLADFYCALGIDFYAIDLRKHGRSLDPHQTPNYIADVSDYFVELDAALDIIRGVDGHTKVLVNGHSTGGLIAALWADRRKDDGVLDAVFLNSPFFEFNVPAAMRGVLGPTFATVARTKPYALVPAGLNEVYGRTIHRDYAGEWDYNLEWKPLAGFPIRAGWLTAIRHAHTELHHGLDIRVPVLIGSSDTAYRRSTWSDAAHDADAVLDPEHMRRWGPGIGRHVTLIQFAGARHDVVLSRKPVRDRVFSELATWTGAYFPASDRRPAV